MDGNKFLFDRIEEAIQATGQSNEYYRGMCNGMLVVKSLIDGAEPEYFKSAEAGTRQNSHVALTCAGACPAYNNELREAAEPLYDYLLRHGDPHTCVVITQRDATLKRDESGVAFVKGGKAREEADAEELRKRLANRRITAEPFGASERARKEKTSAEVLEGGETIRSLNYTIARLQEIILDTMDGALTGITDLRQKSHGGFEVMLHGLNLSVALAYLRAFRECSSACNEREAT